MGSTLWPSWHCAWFFQKDMCGSNRPVGKILRGGGVQIVTPISTNAPLGGDAAVLKRSDGQTEQINQLPRPVWEAL